jgi:hypothetical protein
MEHAGRTEPGITGPGRVIRHSSQHPASSLSTTETVSSQGIDI